MAKPPQYVPFTLSDGLFEGEDQALQFTIYDANHAAQDITGWTISFKMATTKGGTAVVTKAATLTTPSSGVCTVSVGAGDWPAITVDTIYYYTLAKTDSGSAQVLAEGPLPLQASVS